MPNPQLAFYAVLLEIAAWFGGDLLGDHADGLLLWYLVLHGAASLLLASFAILLLPSAIAQPRRPVLLLLAGCSYAVPVLGFIGVLAGIVILRTHRHGASAPNFESIKLPAFDPHQHTASSVRRPGLRGFLGNAKAPTASRMGALVALQYVSGRVATPLLRDVLTDPSEDLRLLAYGMLDKQEKRINQAIDDELKKFADSHDAQAADGGEGPVLAAARRLSDLYWELIYQRLVQGDLRQHALAESAKYCRIALHHAPYDAALMLRHGRLQHALGQPEEAVDAYYKALALGLPATRVLPYLAELRFDQGEHADARRLMSELSTWTALPRLQPVIQYWSPQ